MAAPPPLILVYDGVCRLCDGVVHFILKRDAGGARFRFAALQSRAAEPLLARARISREDALSSFVLLEGGTALRKSDAALAIAAALPAPWPLVAATGRCVPRVLRDAIYGCVARNRYAIFGRTDEGGASCLAPTRAVLARFLDADEIVAAAKAARKDVAAGHAKGE